MTLANWIQRVERNKLTLSRLNGMWSFTGQPLSYKVDIYLQRQNSNRELDILLQAVRAYGNLAGCAGKQQEDGWVIPAEWDRLFREAGQQIMFKLSSQFGELDKRKFLVDSSKVFVLGWQGR